MASRQVLPLLAGILHVPVLYMIGLEQSGNLDSQASAFQAQFSQPLVTGEVLPELHAPLDVLRYPRCFAAGCLAWTSLSEAASMLPEQLS